MYLAEVKWYNAHLSGNERESTADAHNEGRE